MTHIYEGSCPDEGQWDSRDPRCPACTAPSLREVLRQKVDFYRPPLVGGVVGYSPETITGISKDDAFEYALAFYDEIRALLDE